MNAIETILLLAETYGKAVDAEQSTVSWRVFNDTKKLAALVAGGDIQTRRAAAAIKWFSDNWPENAVWPEAIASPERPASSEAA